MIRRACLFAGVLVFLFVGVASAQEMPSDTVIEKLAQHFLVDIVANKVILKYQDATCEQLWQESAQQQDRPKPEENLIQLMQGDPQLRAQFIKRVASPIADKMFQCGMIP